MAASVRAADTLVTAPAAVSGPVQVADVTAPPAPGVDVTAPGALRPPASLPPGALDHAARISVDDLADPIARTLRDVAAARPDLSPLLTALRTGLSPDPVALAAVLQSVWDQIVELATELSDQAMSGRLWSEAGALALGLAPFGLLAPVLADVATALLDEYGPALPPITEYPTELQVAWAALESFAGGMTDELTGAGLLSAGFYAEIYDKFSASMLEHALIATTVVQAGMVVGIVESVVGDLVGLVALVLLLSSGPVLIALLTYVLWSAWQAGAVQLAEDLGRGLAGLVTEPLGKLHDAETGVPFLYLLGRLIGPAFLEAVLVATGASPLSMAAKGGPRVASALVLVEKMKPALPPTDGARKLVRLIEDRAGDALRYFQPLLDEIGGDALGQFTRLMARERTPELFEDLRDLIESDLDGAAATLAKVLATVDGYTDQQYRGLLLLSQHPPHSPVRGGGPYSQFTWAEFLAEEGLEDTVKLLVDLLGAVGQRIQYSDGGLTTVISEFFSGGGRTTGAAGALMAAKSILDTNPGTWLRFEVGELRRVVDIVAYEIQATVANGRVVRRLVVKLEAEIKTYPSGVLDPERRAKLLVQMRKDLVRHATGGDPTLDELVWLLDPQGYEALAEEFKVMFLEAFDKEAGTIAKAGVDVDVVREALLDKLTFDVLVNFYQTP
ncbi:hypothetical protein ACFOW4_18865 [Micromonospora sp. GCM10011542]|uniref:hypothetical protein n=1 Tax=Micromonospora sp. GCM10011542 TaxID=3317337 RepID=UPI00360A30D3